MIDASPLLLIAGWGQSSCFWDRFLPYLDGAGGAARPPIRVDNRETGSAGPCPEGFTVEDMAADALAAVDAAGADRFSVVGHSMGGMIAQALAFMVPERIERLVLVSTRPGISRYVAPAASAFVMPPGVQVPDDPEAAALAVRTAFYEMYMAPGGEPPRAAIAREEAARAQGSAAGIEGMVRQLQALEAWEPPGDLEDLGLDVAVVHGDADPLVPYPNGEVVAELAGVPLVTLPGVGHMVPWEAPEALAAVING